MTKKRTASFSFREVYLKTRYDSYVVIKDRERRAIIRHLGWTVEEFEKECARRGAEILLEISQTKDPEEKEYLWAELERKMLE